MNNGTIGSWHEVMTRFTLHPRSVCRQLITQLEGVKNLSGEDEAKIIRAIESTGIENGVNRMLALLSKNTLNELLKSI